MYNREREPQNRAQPNKHTGLRIALTAVTILGGSTGCRSTTTASIDELSKPKVSATEKQADNIMPTESELGITRIPDFTTIPTLSPTAEPTFTPVLPTNTPEQPSPTPNPTKAPTFTPTGTPTLTETPTTTPTATVAKATETPKQPESPLPDDGVWMGDLFDDKGAKIGKIELVSIPPDKDKLERQILIYYVRKDGTSNTYRIDIQRVQGNSFEASIRTPRTCVGQTVKADSIRVKSNFDSSSRVLAGAIETQRMETVEVVRFQAGFMGSGESMVLDVAKQVKFSSGKFTGDWRSLNVDPFITKCLWFG